MVELSGSLTIILSAESGTFFSFEKSIISVKETSFSTAVVELAPFQTENLACMAADADGDAGVFRIIGLDCRGRQVKTGGDGQQGSRRTRQHQALANCRPSLDEGSPFHVLALATICQENSIHQMGIRKANRLRVAASRALLTLTNGFVALLWCVHGCLRTWCHSRCCLARPARIRSHVRAVVGRSKQAC